MLYTVHSNEQTNMKVQFRDITLEPDVLVGILSVSVRFAAFRRRNTRHHNYGLRMTRTNVSSRFTCPKQQMDKIDTTIDTESCRERSFPNEYSLQSAPDFYIQCLFTHMMMMFFYLLVRQYTIQASESNANVVELDMHQLKRRQCKIVVGRTKSAGTKHCSRTYCQNIEKYQLQSSPSTKTRNNT